MSDAPPPTRPPRRSIKRLLSLPSFSGRASAAWLVFCFAVTAALIPMAARLPLWVRFEIVLAVWWVIWFVSLSWLLHAGGRVTDDHAWRSPRDWLAAFRSGNKQRAAETDNSGCGNALWIAPLEVEGCAWAAVVLFALVVLFAAVWVVFEIALPLVVFLLYFVTRGMLARVVNDPHGCQSSPARSVSWAAVWATVYTGPLALVVWLVHVAHERQLGR